MDAMYFDPEIEIESSIKSPLEIWANLSSGENFGSQEAIALLADIHFNELHRKGFCCITKDNLGLFMLKAITLGSICTNVRNMYNHSCT